MILSHITIAEPSSQEAKTKLWNTTIKLRGLSFRSKQPRVKTRGIATSGYTRPTSSDNFIYGLKPVELRQNIKKETSHITVTDLW